MSWFLFCFTFVLQRLLMIPKWIIITFTVTAAGPLTNKWTRREREMQMIIVVPGIFDYCFLNDGGSALVPFDSLLFRAKKMWFEISFKSKVSRLIENERNEQHTDKRWYRTLTLKNYSESLINLIVFYLVPMESKLSWLLYLKISKR